MTTTKQAKKIESIIKKLTNEIKTKGYYENLGQKEVSVFMDYLSTLKLSYAESCDLKNNLIKRIEAL